MRERGSPPRARQDGLLEETVGEELLLYDQKSHTAHCLSPIAACVWRHCDSEHDLTDLAQFAKVSENLIADVLHELREKGLLDTEPELMQSTICDESRREAIGRIARYGAAAAAGSMIVSATAATPAMASSTSFTAVCVTGFETCCLCADGEHGYSSLPNEAACAEQKFCGKYGGVKTGGFKKEDSTCSGNGCDVD
jgi:hypothetical protein